MPRRRDRTVGITLAALVTVWVAAAVVVAFSEKGKKKDGRRPAAAGRALDPLGGGERFQSGVREPSGVAYHPKLDRLFVVGDEGMLSELDASGTLLRSTALGGNLEDVAALPSGQLLVLSETAAELIGFDPVARRETGRWRLDSAALLGESPRDKSNGFEGLAYQDDPGGRGGLLFLVHQRAPAMVVTVAWNPRASGSLGADQVRDRWRLGGHEDLTAATLMPKTGRLLVIAEKEDRLLVVGKDGGLEAEAALPGLQQEGLCLDGKGALWIADDQDGMLRRLPGAQAALEAGLARPAAAGR